VTVPASRAPGTEPEARLLELVTGHITTKALSVTAELAIADALAACPLTGPQVASAIGAEPAAVTRLLRYLAGFGVVAVAGDHYASTPILDLVRRDSDFADLALLYGGEFSSACRVVDIGGSDGTLLRAILERAPMATGVLFDRKHVITAGSVTARSAGTGAVAAVDRVELVEGDQAKRA
jgi:hypothetical protein